MADTESIIGACLTAAGRYEEAEPLLVRSYSLLRAELGETHRFTLDALQRIIDLYEAWGRPEQAAEYRAKEPVPQGEGGD